jgi:glycosyltransferase involved in cell wall biosynthesis
MKVVLLSPSQGGVAHYGQYLATALREQGVTVRNVNVFLLNFWQIPKLLLLLYRQRAKLIHINAPMLAWSDNLWLNGLACFFPLLLRLQGKKVVLTLHNVPESIDRPSASSLYHLGTTAWVFGEMALLLYSRANRVCVTVKEYARPMTRYRARVSFVPHGVPDSPNNGNASTRKSILAFGYISPTKDYETLLAAFERVHSKERGTRLIIAGGSHPHFPNSLGYLKEKAVRLNLPMEFTGFVQEQELSRLFSSATFVVLPYLTTTGTSGVFHIAARYAKPVIASDIREFRRLLRSGGGLLLYRNRDYGDLANRMLDLLRSPSLALRLSTQNRIFSERNSMRETARQYVNIYQKLS